MSDRLSADKLRKEREEAKLVSMIWWLILWYASDEGKMKIPSEQEWLTCELAAAIYEENVKEKHWHSWRHDDANNECHHEWNEWPVDVNRTFRVVTALTDDGSIESKLRTLLKKFAEYTFQYDHGEKWYDSDLGRFHKYTTPMLAGSSRFKPHREMATKSVQFLRGQEIEIYTTAMAWCPKIGTLMRPYIERDVAYIKTHYSW